VCDLLLIKQRVDFVLEVGLLVGEFFPTALARGTS
jgi:hypothetical protein